MPPWNDLSRAEQEAIYQRYRVIAGDASAEGARQRAASIYGDIRAALWPESLDWGPGKNATRETAATVIREQSLDDGLWFIPQTVPEDYLQRALRRLHAAVERKTPQECAIAALSK